MLLQEIIDLAVDNSKPIGAMLRKCIVLAAQLKNERLRHWANQELLGYKDTDELPEYRDLQLGAYGDFEGPMGARIPNFPIPSMMLEQEHRHFAEKVRLLQSVTVYDELTSLNEEKAQVQVAWPGNLVLYYQDHFFQGDYALMRAWQRVPKSAIVALVETVRTRTLDLALEIKQEVGG